MMYPVFGERPPCRTQHPAPGTSSWEQEVPLVIGCLADTSCWNLPLPKALAPVREYLNRDLLVLALLRLRLMALFQCRFGKRPSVTEGPRAGSKT